MNEEPVSKKSPGIFYGYVIVAAAVCIMTLAWGANRTFGVFLEPMLREFGWSKAGISGAFTLVMIVMGSLSLLAGKLTDRFGPRLVAVVCGIVLGLGYILLSRVSALWHLYLYFGVVTGAGMSVALAPMMSVVARWFVQRRALMTGILISGPALGITTMPLLVSFLISAYGWRWSYVLLGTAVAVIVVVAALFLKRDPGELGLLPYGLDSWKKRTALQTEGLTLRQATGTRQFWVLGLISFCDLFLVNVLVVHLVTYAVEQAIPATQAASILSVAAGVSIPGRILVGGLADRIGNRRALMICLILSVAAFLLLLTARQLWVLYLFAVLYGLSLWVTGAIMSPLFAEWFGLRSHATILACSTFFSAVGSGIGPVVVGYLFDVTGSYRVPFLLCALLSMVSFFALTFLKPLGNVPTDNASPCKS